MGGVGYMVLLISGMKLLLLFDVGVMFGMLLVMLMLIVVVVLCEW